MLLERARASCRGIRSKRKRPATFSNAPPPRRCSLCNHRLNESCWAFADGVSNTLPIDRMDLQVLSSIKQQVCVIVLCLSHRFWAMLYTSSTVPFAMPALMLKKKVSYHAKLWGIPATTLAGEHWHHDPRNIGSARFRVLIARRCRTPPEHSSSREVSKILEARRAAPASLSANNLESFMRVISVKACRKILLLFLIVPPLSKLDTISKTICN